VILAPGSAPAVPPLPGAELALTSDGLLAIDHIPASLAVIGGGVVGMEFAGIFSLLGTRVTVIEMQDQLLTPLDRDVAARFQQLMAKRGIDFRLGARVEAVERERHIPTPQDRRQKDWLSGSANRRSDHQGCSTMRAPFRPSHADQPKAP